VKHTSDSTFSQGEDYTGGQSFSESDRKLHSLLELGQIIGLDLQIDEMLLQIAQKATEMMNAERFSLFLYDTATDELYTTVALGMGKKEIRILSSEGIAGHCFHSGETFNIPDVYKNPHFLKTYDRLTGYHTKNILCMPFSGRSGQRLGVVELINKAGGQPFTQDDETSLRTFSNHAAVFIEMAQLQKERIDALKKSQDELERLNRAKSKALDHLAHELRTPISLMMGTIKILKGKLARHYPEFKAEAFFEVMEKNLVRISDTQQETDKIVRTSLDAESTLIIDEFEHLWRHVESVSALTDEIKGMFQTIRDWIVRFVPSGSNTIRVIPLFEFIDERIKEARANAHHRDLRIYLEGESNLSVIMEPTILEDLISGLIKNAIENTPDEGAIFIKIETSDQKLLIRVQDTGIGITEENKAQVFNGLFHTQETDLYGSRRPYDFYAGGKGLDLLLAKIYGQRFGFDILLESTRCAHIPADKDICPGQISQCPHCQNLLDCQSAGGSTFVVVMPALTKPLSPIESHEKQ
jgi:signal transduction histidine kinase